MRGILAPVDAEPPVDAPGPAAAHDDRDPPVELRVHGVAGTPPELMLQLVPAVRTDRAEQPPDDDDGAITEWRQPPARPQLRAWSWGSLTSGRWYQAFYLVLLPFMLANLAGWALLASPDGGPPTGTDDHADRERPARGVRIRWCVLLVRLAALLVTTIFAFWTQLVVADLVAYQWLVRHAGWPGWTVGAGFAVTAGVLLAVVWLSRIRTRPTRRHVDPWAVWTDPAGRASLHHDQPPMWNSPGINVGLRRLHLSAALGAVALAGCWPSAGGWTTWRTAGLWCAVATLAAVAVLTCWISLADGEGPGSADPAGPPRALRGHGLPPVALVRHGTWPPAAAALALAAVATGGVDTAWVGAHPFLPALRGSALWLSLAVLVVAALVGVVQGRVVPAPGTPPRRRDLRRANAPSILLLAAAIGAALGAGIAEQVARLAGSTCSVGPCVVVGDTVGWMAIVFTSILAAVGLVVALCWLALRLVPRADGRRPPAAVALRSLTVRGSWLTALLGALGSLATVAGIAVALARGGLPPVSAVPVAVSATVVGTLILLTLGLLAAALRHRHVRTPVAIGVAVAVVAVAAVVVWALRSGRSWQVLGVPLPPSTFAEFSLVVAILLPTALVLRRMYAAVRSVAARRGVGVLWDVGTFWPRWFHPLAPPTYSDRAVTGLTDRIEDVEPGEVFVVAAHSQGSVIAGTALLAANPRTPVALLTFGSPWHHLYGEFFPGYFDTGATAALVDTLDRRWRNLYRDTDPIGGPVHDPAVDASALADPHLRIHSDYWLEPEYGVAVARLERAIRSAVQHPTPGPSERTGRPAREQTTPTTR
ncbi:hypothetical protein GCM10023403_25420 [Pseudonocardia benzenivorans]